MADNDIVFVTNCTHHDIATPPHFVHQEKGTKGEAPPPMLLRDESCTWLVAAAVTPVKASDLKRWKENSVFKQEFKLRNLHEGKLTAHEIEQRMAAQAVQSMLSAKAGRSEDRLGLSKRGNGEARAYIGEPNIGRQVFGTGTH
jgi:hypothetical protein